KRLQRSCKRSIHVPFLSTEQADAIPGRTASPSPYRQSRPPRSQFLNSCTLYLKGTQSPGGRLLNLAQVEQLEILAHPEREPRTRVVLIDSLDSRQIPRQPARKNLQSQPCLPRALRADERIVDRPRRVQAVHFAHQVYAPVQRIPKRSAVKQHVILRKERIRC